jgi:hypothetical protein
MHVTVWMCQMSAQDTIELLAACIYCFLIVMFDLIRRCSMINRWWMLIIYCMSL